MSFLSILALKHGFSTLKGLTGSMLSISEHTFCLAAYTFHHMKNLKHYNGKNLCILYSDTEYNDVRMQGPVINFNLVHCDGTVIGCTQVIIICVTTVLLAVKEL